MKPVLELEQVNKKYRIGSGRSGLREIFFFLNGRSEHKADHPDPNDLWALRNVNFEVHAGEVLGIFGRNGAGKTTILKIISRVTRPTSGSISVNGRISALIELGAGFHPDLTGRENIYLNGVILGLTRKELARKFDSIVAFSELEQFIDTPVKRYSSGMYARLGFSVAAHVDPDLLLVDEVLAVGDVGFQQKCYDFIHSYVSNGKTAVFVSHNLHVIEQLCNRVIWLDRGNIRMMGNPTEILPYYFDEVDQSQLVQGTSEKSPIGSSALKVYRVKTMGSRTMTEGLVCPGEDIQIRIDYYSNQKIQKPQFVFAVSGPQGGMPIFMASMLVDRNSPEAIDGKGTLGCTFKNITLTPKVYHVWIEVWGEGGTQNLLKWQKLGTFRVKDDKIQPIGKGGLRHLRAEAPVHVDYEWHY